MMMPQTMPGWLRQRAALTPGRLALVAGSGSGTGWPARLSFAELDRRVGEVAGGLIALGVQPGDRIGVLMSNSLDLACLMHAIPRLGAILVPLNIRLTWAELEPQAREAGVRLLIHGDDTAPLAGSARDDMRLAAADIPRGTYVPGGQVDLDTVHSIIYTSGTTGWPKGAMLTHGNFWWSATGSALNLGHRIDDRWLACMPLFHVGGLSILLRSVIYGIPAIVQAGFDPAAVNQAIEEEGVTIVSVVATMLRRMLEERSGKKYPDSLRCVLLGGGPAPRPLLEACASLCVPVVQTYGLTETASQVVTLAPEDALRKLGSAGKPLFPMELRIEETRVSGSEGTGSLAPRREQPRPPRPGGEILVRGPSVFSGYLNQPAATAKTVRDGWLHTGDLGYLDDEGYLYVLDRREDLIISGGENVYPAEVEAALLAHPSVLDAGVYGIADPEWGQTVAAAVVLRETPAGQPVSSSSRYQAVDIDEIVAVCRERLAGYKVPRQVRVVDALPRNSGGKILRRLLRESEEENCNEIATLDRPRSASLD